MAEVVSRDGLNATSVYSATGPCSCKKSTIIRWCDVDDPLAHRLASILHKWNGVLTVFQDVASKIGTIHIASTSTGTAVAESRGEIRRIEFNPKRCQYIRGTSFDIQRAAAAVLFEFGLLHQDRRSEALEMKAASGKMVVQEFVYQFEEFEFEVHQAHMERLGQLSTKGLFRMDTLPSLSGKVSFPHHLLFQELTAHTKYPEEMFRDCSPRTRKYDPMGSFWPRPIGSREKSILRRSITEYCYCIRNDAKGLKRLDLEIKKYEMDYGTESNLVVNLRFMARGSIEIQRAWSDRFDWMMSSRQPVSNSRPPCPGTGLLLGPGSFPL